MLEEFFYSFYNQLDFLPLRPLVLLIIDCLLQETTTPNNTSPNL